MLIQIAFWATALAAVTNTAKEYQRCLMMLQQNSYRSERYRRWLSQSGDTSSPTRLTGMAVFLLAMAVWAATDWAMLAILLFSLFNLGSLCRAKYKKPLVWTRRVKRLYGVMTLLSAIVIAAAIMVFGGISTLSKLYAAAVAVQGLYCGSHLITLAALWLLEPVERHINQGYVNDAKRILATMPDLKIIGITGSYGKTSTKHYLHRILSEKYDTLMTPGSFNTPMGVVRTVREHLKPYNEVFIVEMGAKNIGDIKEICDIVNPQAGIVTAVGEQHLESFKTIENVQRTKFELVDALPSSGLAVVNDDFPYAASRPVSNVECIRYAIRDTKGAEVTARDIAYTPKGTSFTIAGPGWEMNLQTRLVGECNISNLMAAVVMARHLGVSDEKIRIAVAHIEQVEHRLNMKHTPGGLTIIDDAFNSNPTGSAMALDVLASMGPGKRIIITPGMIELGDRQDELNRGLGKKIATSADEAIIVGEYNREAILAGIAEAGMDSAKVHAVDSFVQAQTLMTSMARPGDTVLYENDLPDTFK
ncbi:MAG: UDP-N-acetylmuramoyl-tripeptide--D-alanyl-D-alanine ligase [Pseudoflavonifractor sp.]|nr:UDP-N-acetylmuramoyl-tripeptide--D-alanyl-D-alanine ligase [Alloprevotella sp.]MCM1116094.1 UDP-N-acetylmuramoyl-tripeptide--D-alanyl-D-alanine ligase [Pseudoflavonifractor sp.]